MDELWSRWPITRRLDTSNPERTVAVEIAAPVGPLLVYGTVLPWGGDPGPDAACPAKGWSEMDRVLPLQLAEWRRLRGTHPEVALVVAGDLNMNFGGPALLRDEAVPCGAPQRPPRPGDDSSDDRRPGPGGSPPVPPSDHVLVPASWSTRVVSAWEGTTPEGVHLSDHSGLVVEVAGPADPARPRRRWHPRQMSPGTRAPARARP